MEQTRKEFISYAQNREDVMLWRALKHVVHGFYIDVGAWSPVDDSVTKGFYDHGWSGINIEPNPELYCKLQEDRPLDTNVMMVVGDSEGTQVINFFGNTGLSTLDDSIAEEHQKAGWEVNRQEVQATTLVSIWDKYVPPGREVNFLKIDVEGFEERVLRGNDWERCRPWVVVIESTKPMSQLESHGQWESMLLDSGYIFVYADGLNRFYVAGERDELASSFEYPPNIFDDYMEFRELIAVARVAELEGIAADAESRAADAESRAADAESRAADAESRAADADVRASDAESRAAAAEKRAIQSDMNYMNIKNSRSWRITRPMRIIGSMGMPIKGKIKSVARGVIFNIFVSARKSSIWRMYGSAIRRHFPGMHTKLQNIANVNTGESICSVKQGEPEKDKVYKILDSLARQVKESKK